MHYLNYIFICMSLIDFIVDRKHKAGWGEIVNIVSYNGVRDMFLLWSECGMVYLMQGPHVWPKGERIVTDSALFTGEASHVVSTKRSRPRVEILSHFAELPRPFRIVVQELAHLPGLTKGVVMELHLRTVPSKSADVLVVLIANLRPNSITEVNHDPHDLIAFSSRIKVGFHLGEGVATSWAVKADEGAWGSHRDTILCVIELDLVHITQRLLPPYGVMSKHL